MDTQTLGDFAHRVAPILDLRHRTAFERVCEFSAGHIALLASKLPSKASANLGAIRWIYKAKVALTVFEGN